MKINVLPFDGLVLEYTGISLKTKFGYLSLCVLEDGEIQIDSRDMEQGIITKESFLEYMGLLYDMAEVK